MRPPRPLRSFSKSLLCTQALIGAVLLAGSAAATTIELDFDSLPSAQGWTYRGSTPESSAFSINNGVLSMSSGYYNHYNMPGAVNHSDPFVLSARARVISGWGSWLHFYVTTGTHLAVIGLSGDAIYYHDGAVFALLASGLDNTRFHDLRMEGAPDVSARVYFDNLLLGSIPFTTLGGDGLYFGDGGGTGAGTAEITAYRFVQNSLPMPEPASSLLFVSGLAALVARGRRFA